VVRALALLLTALTGFSGLVYEVAWQRYLATLLGSHSEASSAVLGIFLGGLSVGYWLFGRITRRTLDRAHLAGRPPRLLFLYGLLEGTIGLYVFAFPWLFRGVQVLSYSLPHGAGGFGFAIDVGLSMLLIGPASVLMGGTIPILTQALSRSLEDATRFHAFVYAFNTVGAFVGALAAGFLLIPWLGLEDVMLAMGCLNVGAGAIFLALGRRPQAVVDLGQIPDAKATGTPAIPGFAFYAAIALLTGFAMMALQTTVMRLGALSLGSSQFTFSMVVAVFVLAIAIGSFLVSAFSRIPTWVVVANQWGIGLLLLALYPRLDESPYAFMLLRSAFENSNEGFAAFHFMALLVILLVVGLPVILSGASLPLLFHHMRRQVDHLGDLAGYLYSWNTVGSLLGALLGGYALLFWLDLHHIYRIAIGCLLLAAGILTMRVYGRAVLTAAVLLPLLIVVAVLPAWRPEILYSGLFRVVVAEYLARASGRWPGAERFILPFQGQFKPKILFSTDDPTASVVVREYNWPNGDRSREIATQGKSDGDTRIDMGTTALLAAVPSMLAEKAERAFVIGWGVGSTAGELGSFTSMREIEVAEISPGVMEAAPLFDFATEGASTNPKIHVIQSDAYRALMRTTGTYDVIVSEPSHVWVAGVEMLFTREFLEATKSRLSPGGVYCQFIHRYELDDEALALVLRTFASVYEHVSVWQDVNRTLMLLGFQNPRLATDHYRLAERYRQPDFRATLQRAKIRSFPALLAHELIPVGVINAMELPGPLQSLYHPRLNDVAGRAFFRSDFADLPFTGFGEPARIGARNSLVRRYAQDFGGRLPDQERAEVIVESCQAFGPLCSAMVAEWISQEPEDRTMLDRLIEWTEQIPNGLSRERLDDLARLFPSRSGSAEPTSSSALRGTVDDYYAFYHHASPFDPQALLDRWSRCRQEGPTEEACHTAVAARPLRPGTTLEENIEECVATARIGHDCQRGLDAARVLVEEGEIENPPTPARPGGSTSKRQGT
jgi:spermidine synthase